MSWYDPIPGVNIIGDAVQGKWGDAGKNLATGGLYGIGAASADAISPQDASHGGVAGPADPAAQARLQQQPDGSWMDPATGQKYSDQSGQVAIQAPSQTSLVTQNNGQGQNLFGQLGQSRGQVNGAVNQLGQVYDQQGNLISGPNGLTDTRNSFLNTINNPNASSVAKVQLGAGLDSSVANQRSQAAGATAGNSFLAERNAANNIGGLNAATNQSAALLRAQEVASAQQGLLNTQGKISDVLNGQRDVTYDQGQLGQGQYKADLGGSTAYSQLANNGREAQDKNNMGYAQDKAAANKYVIGKGLQGAQDLGKYLGI
jgi:hypothetical protein